jgi:hypothetical protein
LRRAPLFDPVLHINARFAFSRRPQSFP